MDRAYRRGMTAILEPQISEPDAARATAPVPAEAVRVEPAPRPDPAPGSAPGRTRRILGERPELTPAGVRAIGIAMVALTWAVVAIEPPADGPLPDPTGWVALLVNVEAFALLAGTAGFAMGRRWALWAGLLFAGISAVDIALCPASGHHAIGGWWFGQVALGAATVLLPALALWRTRPRRR